VHVLACLIAYQKLSHLPEGEISDFMPQDIEPSIQRNVTEISVKQFNVKPLMIDESAVSFWTAVAMLPLLPQRKRHRGLPTPHISYGPTQRAYSETSPASPCYR
jgi:hypothetical protein